jgi:hypothetical protein
LPFKSRRFLSLEAAAFLFVNYQLYYLRLNMRFRGIHYDSDLACGSGFSRDFIKAGEQSSRSHSRLPTKAGELLI